ncbi:hypothetical protein BO82DRAFT_156603 [Aspergillus uvarum CBS 121591]|uniref:DUF7587 domain-containing protein n=1 Tax=Aspergillus uvarum CBS 121591 TaxID=1448315 RepID=A0A319CS90_9EURO|nr:hypothetical protein BO82DRAFT_156603 [Aspergillus uvarum CBS 121591]PYH78428.1 hypothetical protein BO82DRAFT_156603 [Aspergillus uvarum CBS 121591]
MNRKSITMKPIIKQKWLGTSINYSKNFSTDSMTSSLLLTLSCFLTSPDTVEGLHCQRDNHIYNNTGDGLTFSEKKRNIENRLADADLTLPMDRGILKRLNKKVLGQSFDRLIRPELDTPSVFYRAFQPTSHSRYDPDLGFRSSKQPLTIPCHHEGTLCDSRLVGEEVLRVHCERSQPSDLIAMSDSPARILKIVAGWGYSDKQRGSIAVINMSKLLAFKVLFNRTTTLAKECRVGLWAENRDTGLQWANNNYWVAYRWIPVECIEFFISVATLERVCESHNIEQFDHAKRLSLEELQNAKWNN